MVTSSSINVLLIILPCISGFNTGRRPSFAPRPRTPMPPLRYTDIEPEIRSITISPDIRFNDTSVFVPNLGKMEDERSALEEVNARRKTSPTKAKSKSKSASSAAEKKPRKTTGVKGKHKIVWQTHYDELRAYRAEHGHCLVPQKYAPNPKLGYWVMQQRRQHAQREAGKRSSLAGVEGERRTGLLDGIGFVWRVQRRGPRGALGRSLMRRARRGEDGGVVVEDDVVDSAEFYRRMTEKSAVRSERSDDEIRAAWLERFEALR